MEIINNFCSFIDSKIDSIAESLTSKFIAKNDPSQSNEKSTLLKTANISKKIGTIHIKNYPLKTIQNIESSTSSSFNNVKKILKIGIYAFAIILFGAAIFNNFSFVEISEPPQRKEPNPAPPPFSSSKKDECTCTQNSKQLGPFPIENFKNDEEIFKKFDKNLPYECSCSNGSKFSYIPTYNIDPRKMDTSTAKLDSKKICFFTYCLPKTSKESYDISSENHKQYCEKHGYTYHTIPSSEQSCDGPKDLYYYPLLRSGAQRILNKKNDTSNYECEWVVGASSRHIIHENIARDIKSFIIDDSLTTKWEDFQVCISSDFDKNLNTYVCTQGAQIIKNSLKNRETYS